MAIKVELSGVYKKLSSSNSDMGRVCLANQALIDMNENYVPQLSGDLRMSVVASSDGRTISWNTPYARAQYYGSNGRAVFSNYTTPGTGPRWDEKAKNIHMNGWIRAYVKGANL